MTVEVGAAEVTESPGSSGASEAPAAPEAPERVDVPKPRETVAEDVTLESRSPYPMV